MRKVLDRRLQEGRGPGDAGIVDQDLHRAVLRLDPVEQRGDPVGVGHVAGIGGKRAQCLARRRDAGCVHVGQQHARAVLLQRLGAGIADAARAPGHKCQSSCHRVVLSVVEAVVVAGLLWGDVSRGQIGADSVGVAVAGRTEAAAAGQAQAQPPSAAERAGGPCWPGAVPSVSSTRPGAPGPPPSRPRAGWSTRSNIALNNKS